MLPDNLTQMRKKKKNTHTTNNKQRHINELPKNYPIFPKINK